MTKQPNEPVNILMVDDVEANLIALEAILEPLGQRLVRAQSGTEALRQLLNDDFAVVLLDVRMPDMSGFEAATLIRSRPRSRNTPIIFLTGSAQTSDAMFEGYSTGAVDYLMKPASPPMLRSKVEVFIQLAMARVALEKQVQEKALAAQDLAAANLELDSFCAAVAHDLRTPLSQVMGFAQLLEMTAAHKLDAKEQQHLARIVNVGHHMTQMVNDFLTFARLSSVPLTMSEVNMDELVNSVVNEQTQGFGAVPGVAWRIEHLPATRGDPNMLAHVWSNLISNALKYSSRSHPPRVTLQGSDDGVECVYWVIDNGVGFDMSQSHRLFTAFSRLHAPSNYEGIGIGLSLVKRIVARHGGRVWADSESGKGATFFFSLPSKGRYAPELQPLAAEQIDQKTSAAA